MQTSVENGSCSASDKMAKATLGKKDQGKKIHLNGCFTINWQCGSADSIEITLDEGRRQPITKPVSTAKPAAAQNSVVGIYRTKFYPQPTAVLQQPSAQTGLSPGLGRPIDPAVAKDLTCCCEKMTEQVDYITHYLTRTNPSIGRHPRFSESCVPRHRMPSNCPW